jgi:YD repeat-containing protein
MRTTVYKSKRHDGYIDEFNEFNQVIHRIYDSGFEEWWTYDDYDNVIYYESNDNFKYFNIYDDKGNLIYHRNNKNCREYYTYDKNNHRIYSKYKNGNIIDNEIWTEYDEDGNLIDIISSRTIDRYSKFYN